MKITRSRIFPALVAAAVLMSATPAFPGADTVELSGASLKVVVEKSPFRLSVLDSAGKQLLATDGPVSFTHETEPRVFRFILYWLWTRGWIDPWTHAREVVDVSAGGNELVLGLAKKSGAGAVARMKIFFVDEITLKVETEILDPGANRTLVRFALDKDDRYFGMGERFNSAEHRGSRVRNWAEEGGLGLNRLGEVPPFTLINPAPRGPDMTYYPMPYFLNPDKGYAFLLDDVVYSMFDFGVTSPGRVRIENWNKRFDFRIFYGPSPKEIIENVTAKTGRVSVPIPWVYAPMNAVVQSEDRVLEVAKLLRAEKIPTSAVWSESWWWRTEWEVNRELFPHYEQMIAKLHEDGFRHLGYFQPYLSGWTKSFAEADARGYLTKDRDGKSYAFPLGTWKKAQLDVYNPEAVQWWKDSFFAKAEEMGVDGWMHDFGEHTPPYSVSYGNRSGWDTHNEYPLIWAKIGREFWDQARPDGDYCFYIRGGYTGAQRYAQVMWTGDQNASFEKEDGLASNIPGILSAGISGHPIVTTDIAGYNCFTNKSADREVFMRWTELGALLPVMRLHRGQDEVCDHWNFDEDPETLDHYKKYAILHTSLFPYFYTLSYEAAQKGWPVIRHLMLEFPNDRAAWKLDYQFMIGDRFLAAPVWKRHVREWKLYLPQGQWAHWWSGKAYQGPGEVKVEAGLGEVPLFARAGKIIPIFDGEIDTLVKEDREDIKGWDDANASVRILFFGKGSDEYTLWDGTKISCNRDEGEGACNVSGAPVERSYSYDFR